MADLTIITASAGTGKTYHLEEILLERIASGDTRPEAVLATTFTRKAAAELQERVRRRLLASDKPKVRQMALRLGAARIGTVNAVCGQLAKDFAFDLGLSPDLEILDEETAGQELKAALSDALKGETAEKLNRLAERIRHLNANPPDYEKKRKRETIYGWHKHVSDLVSKARSNGMGAHDLRHFVDESVTEFLGLLPESEDPPSPEGRDEVLRQALHAFVHGVNLEEDTQKNTGEGHELASKYLGYLERGQGLPWSDRVKLTKLNYGKKNKNTKALGDAVVAAALTYGTDPRLRRDCESAIRLVFEAAADALDGYQKRKEAMGAMDFTDQECLALRLLRREDIGARLREELDLVLVDEFQDTSPIQLAIFLRLKELARHAVWVGDRKQAIYGFRDADPQLMEQAIRALDPGSVDTPLDRNFRSRPALVDLSSELFAPVFEKHGIPEGQTRARHHSGGEPEGLGPPVELWNLTTTSNDTDPAAIAAGVRALCDDPEFRVRTKNDEARTGSYRDIAVLCRDNDQCAKIAAALEDVSIPARLGRPGLLETPEATATLAALRLLVDPADTLARAELSRLLTADLPADDWLDSILSASLGEETTPQDEISRLLSAGPQSLHLGPVEALDLAIETAGIRDLCLRWGGAGDRLANIEALRSHALAHTDWCTRTGAGCTPIGLLAWFDDLAGRKKDDRTVAQDANAVTVITWHSAKGLEWPVAVLYLPGGSKAGKAGLLGTSLLNATGDLDPEHPLEGRRIRFWPDPFSPQRTDTVLAAPLDTHEDTRAGQRLSLYEELRLLYVIWTRAKDRIVLATRKQKLDIPPLNLLNDGLPMLTAPSNDRITWGGLDLPVTIRDLEPLAPTALSTAPSPEEGYDTPETLPDHPQAFIRPSEAKGKGKSLKTVTIGDPISTACPGKERQLGDAIHAFFAADRPEFLPEERIALAKGCLERQKIPTALQPQELVQAADNLYRWANEIWPGAVWHREMPVFHRLENGQIMRGEADLVLETKDGFVLIDHKSKISDTKSTANYEGQLAIYAEALAVGLGKQCHGARIHLPLAGKLIAMQPAERKGGKPIV